LKIFNTYLSDNQSKQEHILAYYNCLYNDVTTKEIDYNFIDNNQIKVKYEISVKDNNKINTCYNWLNYTPTTNDNLCVFPIDYINGDNANDENILENNELHMTTTVCSKPSNELHMSATVI
jgi:hypothetical protein